MVDSSLHTDAERLLVHELLRTWRELNRTHFENTLRPPVLAMVDPEIAEKIVPATSVTTANRPGTRLITASTASTDFKASPL